MKPIEALQTAGAWKKAIEGEPYNVSEVGGALTDIPAKMGIDLLNNVTDGLQVLSDVASSPDSVIGAVVTAIKAVVSSIKKSAAQREVNYSEARVGYLSEARGIRVASKLPGFQGCASGFWRYPRASIAKDHCVPIWDPLGTPGNLPSWMVPYGWTKKPSPWWPYDAPQPVGNSLPDICYDWEDINLDAGDSDCSVNASKIVIVAWPWAWPLCCPLRAAGSFLRYSKLDLEKIVAAQYMLPTPQHVLTQAYDVAESKRIITAAMLWWWPKAYQIAPGLWANSEEPRQTNGYDPKNPGSGTPFSYYSAALSRIEGFERCRSAMLANPELVPYEVRALFKKNPDFSTSPPKGEPMLDLKVSKIGAVPSLPSNVAAWVAAGLGTVVVIGGITYFMATRGAAAGQLISRGHRPTAAITRHHRGRK